MHSRMLGLDLPRSISICVAMQTLQIQSDDTNEEVSLETRSNNIAHRLPAHRLAPITERVKISAKEVEAQKLSDLANLVRLLPGDGDEIFNAKLVKLYDQFVGINPTDSVQSILAIQFIAANEAALECIRRSFSSNASPRVRASELAMADRLMKTGLQLVAGLDRQKGKSDRTVVVKYKNRLGSSK